MKYVVLLIVLVVVIGIWRSRRDSETASRTPSSPPAAPPGGPQDILACAHCGVHIPQAEALMLGSQAYCCPEHRQQGPA